MITYKWKSRIKLKAWLLRLLRKSTPRTCRFGWSSSWSFSTVLSLCSRPASERIQICISMSWIDQIRFTSVEFDLAVASAMKGTGKKQQLYSSTVHRLCCFSLFICLPLIAAASDKYISDNKRAEWMGQGVKRLNLAARAPWTSEAILQPRTSLFIWLCGRIQPLLWGK